jgi:hypothetical protein
MKSASVSFTSLSVTVPDGAEIVPLIVNAVTVCGGGLPPPPPHEVMNSAIAAAMAT